MGVSETCSMSVMVGLVQMEMPISLLLPICKGMDGSNGSIYMGYDDTLLLLSCCAEYPVGIMQVHLLPKVVLAQTTERAVIFQTVTNSYALYLLNKCTECKGRGGKKYGKRGKKHCKKEINRKHLAAGVT